MVWLMRLNAMTRISFSRIARIIGGSDRNASLSSAMATVLRSTRNALGARKKSMKCSNPPCDAHGLAQMPWKMS